MATGTPHITAPPPRETPPRPGRPAALALAACAAPALGAAVAVAVTTGLFALPPHLVTPAALAAAAVGLAAGLGLARLLLRRLAAERLVGEALAAWDAGEPDPDSLTVTAPAAASAGHVPAWNRLVAHLADARRHADAGHAADRLASTGPRAADAGPVLDLLPFGVLVVNPDGTVTTANGAAGRMLRRSRDRLVNAPIDKLITADAFTKLRAEIATGQGSRGGHAELSLHPDDEHPTTARVTVRPMARTERPDTLVLLEDITQQRAADRSRHLFVAQATHELRTPLTNIGLYVERAIDLDERETAERAECLNVINDEVLRLNRLVGEVLSVSEIEAGSLSVKRDDVKLDALVDDLRDSFTRQAEKKQITVKFDLPPKLPTVQGDRDKIALALHNLLGNAIKYTPAGGGVTVTVGEAEGRLQVAVADTGIGIGEADLPRVFDKFYRAKDDRLATIDGSGLGLALAREVIRLHHGDITVESTLNQGSTFTLTLPVEAHAATAS